MEVELQKTNAPFHFETVSGNAPLNVIASPELSGEAARGHRPMELILSALGSCMAIDVLHILGKQREPVEDFRVQVKGTRSTGVPAVFTDIAIHISVDRQVNETKLARAIRMSEETYCSVHHMLSPAVRITTSYSLGDGE